MLITLLKDIKVINFINKIYKRIYYITFISS